MILHLTEKEFEEKEFETCLIDFSAEWCPPCQMLAPVLETVAETHKDKMNFYKIDIDESINLAQKYGVTHVPTLIILKNGEVADKAVGFMDEAKLSEFIEKNA
ncbi:MAG: thioredoxin [Oscillospiraceae bacterium]|nr:thioredoxin [Oscillospiraceae bacterium]